MDFCDGIWSLSSSNKVFLNPKKFPTIPEPSHVSSSIEKFRNDIYWVLTTRLYLLVCCLSPMDIQMQLRYVGQSRVSVTLSFHQCDLKQMDFIKSSLPMYMWMAVKLWFSMWFNIFSDDFLSSKVFQPEYDVVFWSIIRAWTEADHLYSNPYLHSPEVSKLWLRSVHQTIP